MPETYYSRNREKVLKQQREYRASKRQFVRDTVRCSTYGITREDLSAIMASQQGLCPVCRKALGDRYDIDHCHTTGRVRGLLHHRCNVALGYLEDSPDILESAALYLRRSYE